MRSRTGTLTTVRSYPRLLQQLKSDEENKQHFPTPLIFTLLVALPLFSFFYLFLIHEHRGNVAAAFSSLLKQPLLARMAPLLFDVTAWKFTVVFVSLQLIFHWILPHDTVYLLSSAGNRKKPVNGFSSSLLICLLYVMGCGLGMYRDDVVFIHFPSIITCFAVVCVTGYLIMLINYRFGDYYNVTTVSEFCFGVELHPTILDIDVKHFVRSRITLVLWPMFIISALYYQRNRYGKITSSLAASSVAQMIYIMRYHWTEYLALNSLDYKRANCGFYKLWSDMVMFPVLYCSSIASIAHSQKSISFLSCCVLTVAALIFIYLTTVIDKQKYEFRKQKGIIKINGVDPYFITAKYKDDKGDTSANLLLGSGYWSLCRHPNYIFEAATFAVFSAFQGYSPISVHFPALFVAGFLFLRLYNDESRCLVKYGQYWIQYCNKVPFRLIPGLY
ncbi:unnamed protein product [Nippostrongylus brasiliensis]|uniref:7-dehydrocholesterol reductase n=1 Tax=Nippostrongylus brasiliensis TaxID=27835 RepID=A0A0N4YFF5_NIPBR|nr:unnamed protein product [Nippostrongylus brasiliensis]